MVHRLVISINMSMNMVENLRKMSGAGVQMIDRIIAEIESDHRIKLIRYQVLVVIGTLNVQTSTHPVSSLLNWSITWNYSYLTSGERPRVSKVMDKAVSSIIMMATRELLWKFYSGDAPFTEL